MSFLKKLMISDLLFGVQIVFALWFCWSQCSAMIVSTAGVNVTWFVSWMTFSSFNFALTWQLDRARPSRVTKHLLFSHGLWGSGALVCTGVMVMTGSGLWNNRDWVNVIVVTSGTIVVCCVAKVKHLPVLPFPDPLIKGWLALCFKALPQFVLAINIAVVGNGSGISSGAILLGHITIGIRLIQLSQTIYRMKREGGTYDRNCKGSLLSEIGNEVSWIAVTLIWFMF